MSFGAIDGDSVFKLFNEYLDLLKNIGALIEELLEFR